jgi:hypothetical protein
MGALFQDRLADWPSVVLRDSDSEIRQLRHRSQTSEPKVRQKTSEEEVGSLNSVCWTSNKPTHGAKPASKVTNRSDSFWPTQQTTVTRLYRESNITRTSRPLYSRGRNPDTLWIGGWLCARGRLDAVENGNVFYPCREPKPSHTTMTNSLVETTCLILRKQTVQTLKPDFLIVDFRLSY